MTGLTQTVMFRNGQMYRSRLAAPQTFRQNQHQPSPSGLAPGTSGGARSLPMSPSKANYQQLDTLQRPPHAVPEGWAPSYNGQQPIQAPPYNRPPPGSLSVPGARLPAQPLHQYQPRPLSADKISHIPKAIVNQRPAQAVRPSLRPPAPLSFPRTNPIAMGGVSTGDAVHGVGAGNNKNSARQEMFGSNFSPRFLSSSEDFRPRTCPPERSGSADILSQTTAVSDSLPMFQRISDNNSSNSRSAGVLFHSARAPMQHFQQQQQRIPHRDLHGAPSSLPFQKYPASNQMEHYDYVDEGPTINSASCSVSTESCADSKLTNGSCFSGSRPVDHQSRPLLDHGNSIEISKETFIANTDIQKRWLAENPVKTPSSVPSAPPMSPPSYPTQLGPRLSDDQLMGMPPGQLLLRFREAESEITRLMMEHGKTVRELNKQLKNTSAELQSVRDEYRRYCEDNQELRDLCCFLDDDRQKGRKLAREWQRFGRYTASVMRQEVSAYQNKLKDLDTKQQDLLKDNLELKELCLYLDEERQTSQHQPPRVPGTGTGLCMNCGSALEHPRDDGDGSSSSTAADEPRSQPGREEDSGVSYDSGGPRSGTEARVDTETLQSRGDVTERGLQRHRGLLNERILQYIRSLERRIALQSCSNHTLPTSENGACSISNSCNGGEAGTEQLTNDGANSRGDLPGVNSTQGRPDAVAQAMFVLDVQEQLNICPRASNTVTPSADISPNSSEFPELSQSVYDDRVHSASSTGGVCVGGRTADEQGVSPQLDSSEEALIRQMCNVVWRKLEEVPS